MEAKTKDLWVLIETKEDGTPRKVGLELLNPGRRLADKQEGKLVAEATYTMFLFGPLDQQG